MVPVPAEALREVLSALIQPISSPQIRELMLTRNLSPLISDSPNPINVLVEAFNRWVDQQKSKEEPGQTPP